MIHSRMRCCVLGFILLACMLTGCVHNDWRTIRAETIDARSAEVDGEFRFGQPHIRVKINGHDAGVFLFDTGSPINTITAEGAERVGLRVMGEQLSLDANNNRRVSPMGLADRVEFGPMLQRDVRFLITERHRLSDKDVIGIIGINGLQGVTIDLDAASERIALTNERLDPSDEGVVPIRTLEFAKAHVPLEFEDAGVLGGTRTVWALLDTGNSGGLRLNTHQSAAVTFIERSRPVDVSVGSHDVAWVISDAPLRVAMMLGGTRIEGIEATVNQKGNNIGVELLSKFRVRIDGVSRLAAFTRADRAERLVALERFGMMRFVEYNGGVHPGYVFSDSLAAEYGITYKDIIVEIDGHPPRADHLETDYWVIPLGMDSLRMRIRRAENNEEFDAEFPIGWDNAPRDETKERSR